MLTVAHLIAIDDLDGPMNMAVDEVLWQAAADGASFLRLYGWADRPCVSLGYFQCHAEVERALSGRAGRFVRRLTGGGAIVHDHDLTYSLALPASLAPATHELYSRVHEAIARELTALVAPVQVGMGWTSASVTDPLCFRRSDAHAIQVGGCKILGSAQRRRRGSVLMHGSFLLAASSLDPDTPGLREIVGRSLQRDHVGDVVVRAIGAALRLELLPQRVPPELWERATEAAAKYRSPAWSHRR